MESKLQLLWLLIFIVSSYQQDLDSIGLLAPTRSVLVARGKTLQQVTIKLPIHGEPQEFSQHLAKLDLIINDIKNIPGLEKTQPPSGEIGHIVKHISDSSRLISAFLGFLQTYKDISTMAAPSHICILEFPVITPTLLSQTVGQIQLIKNQISLTATAQELLANNNKMLIETERHLREISEILDKTSTSLEYRLSILEELTNKLISGTTLTAVQSRSCVTNGDLENVRLIDCQKNDQGLHCQIEIEHTTNEKNYTLYTPIAYNKIKLTGIKPSDFFVKDNAGSWGLLDCETDPTIPDLDSYDICTFLPYDNECSRAFSQTDISQYTKYCNLTYTEESEINIGPYGTLIPESYSNIKILSNPENPIPYTPPLVIQTNDIITATSINSKEVVVKPTYSFPTLKIIKTWLTEEDVRQLTLTANLNMLWSEINYSEILDLTFFVILSVIIPVVAFLIKNSCKYNSNELLEKAKRKKSNMKTNLTLQRSKILK